jgi:hypothetical protein
VVDWIGFPQDRDKCKDFVNAVMNLWGHKVLGNHQGATQLVAPRVVFSSIVH